MTRKPTVPKGLSPRSRGLWKSLLDQYEMSLAELQILRLGLVALDRADGAAEVIAAEGAYISDRFGGSKAHTACDVENRSRSAFSAAVKQLGISVDEAPASLRIGARPGPKVRPAKLRSVR